MADLLRLGSTHRASQDRLATALAAVLKRAYERAVVGGYQNDDIVQSWIADMVPLILMYRTRSEGMARSFYDQASPRGRGFATPADPVEDEAIATSLRVTGVIEIVEGLKRGKSFDESVERAEKMAVGAAARHALDGGRSLIRNTVANDQTALGYYRQTKAGCCSFCAVLASRGQVYKGESFNESDPRFIGDDSDVKVHDHCHCQLVPVFSRTQGLPDLNERFGELWARTSRGLSGNDALNAFRRAYEAEFLGSRD